MKVPFWKFIVAYFIDWLIIMVTSALFGGVIGFMSGLLAGVMGADVTAIMPVIMILSFLIGVAWMLLYFALTEYFWHASVGKLAMGIIVMPKPAAAPAETH